MDDKEVLRQRLIAKEMAEKNPALLSLRDAFDLKLEIVEPKKEEEWQNAKF